MVEEILHRSLSMLELILSLRVFMDSFGFGTHRTRGMIIRAPTHIHFLSIHFIDLGYTQSIFFGQSSSVWHSSYASYVAAIKKREYTYVTKTR